MAMPVEPSQYRLELTEKAARVIREAFSAEKVSPSDAFVRVGAKPGGCSGFKYDMSFAERGAVTDKDQVFSSHGINLVVDRVCLTDVLGSVEIDFQDKNLVEQGFKFRPLNAATDQCGCGESFTAVKSRA
ncbi:MAG: HesB/IscA family protein [SAR324 cluster bacterium]